MSFRGANCYRYIFTIFDLYAEEPNACTRTDKLTDDDVRENEEPVRSDDETCTAQGVHIQEVQEVQEPPVLPDTCTSTSMDADEVSEKRGDDINLEDKTKAHQRKKRFHREARAVTLCQPQRSAKPKRLINLSKP